jgi:hypothetical protein
MMGVGEEGGVRGMHCFWSNKAGWDKGWGVAWNE